MAQFEDHIWEKGTIKECLWSRKCTDVELKRKVRIKSEKIVWNELKIKRKRKISHAQNSKRKGTWTVPKRVPLGAKGVQHVADSCRKEESICVIYYLILEG